MNLKTAKIIYIVCTVVELALFVTAYLWLSSFSKYLGIAGLLVLCVNVVFSLKYLRCPHCGALLTRVILIRCCPYCGEALDEPPKGGIFD